MIQPARQFADDAAGARHHILGVRSTIAHARETASEHRDRAADLIAVAEELDREAAAKERAVDLLEASLEAMLAIEAEPAAEAA